jgi:hypothetical protein
MGERMKTKNEILREEICKLLEIQSRQGTAYMFRAQEIVELITKLMEVEDEK